MATKATHIRQKEVIALDYVALYKAVVTLQAEENRRSEEGSNTSSRSGISAALLPPPPPYHIRSQEVFQKAWDSTQMECILYTASRLVEKTGAATTRAADDDDDADNGNEEGAVSSNRRKKAVKTKRDEAPSSSSATVCTEGYVDTIIMQLLEVAAAYLHLDPHQAPSALGFGLLLSSYLYFTQPSAFNAMVSTTPAPTTAPAGHGAAANAVTTATAVASSSPSSPDTLTAAAAAGGDVAGANGKRMVLKRKHPIRIGLDAYRTLLETIPTLPNAPLLKHVLAALVAEGEGEAIEICPFVNNGPAIASIVTAHQLLGAPLIALGKIKQETDKLKELLLTTDGSGGGGGGMRGALMFERASARQQKPSLHQFSAATQSTATAANATNSADDDDLADFDFNEMDALTSAANTSTNGSDNDGLSSALRAAIQLGASQTTTADASAALDVFAAPVSTADPLHSATVSTATAAALSAEEGVEGGANAVSMLEIASLRDRYLQLRKGLL